MPDRLETTIALRVLLYSDSVARMQSVRAILGTYPAADVGPVEYVEVTNGRRLTPRLQAGDIDLCVFDGEAQPAGGLGMCRQVKDEVDDCPPVLVMVGRRDDAWLAAWSRADAALAYPLDPIETARTVAGLLRPAAVGASEPSAKLIATEPRRAWCGVCGRSFLLSAVVVPPTAGHCPACGRPFAPGYAAVLVQAVRDVLADAPSAGRAAGALRQVAPHLHLVEQV